MSSLYTHFFQAMSDTTQLPVLILEVCTTGLEHPLMRHQALLPFPSSQPPHSGGGPMLLQSPIHSLADLGLPSPALGSLQKPRMITPSSCLKP